MTWHLRVGRYARAFTPRPLTPWEAVALLWRGWRPFNYSWWSKPSRNQKALERA